MFTSGLVSLLQVLTLTFFTGWPEYVESSGLNSSARGNAPVRSLIQGVMDTAQRFPTLLQEDGAEIAELSGAIKRHDCMNHVLKAAAAIERTGNAVDTVIQNVPIQQWISTPFADHRFEPVVPS